MKTEKFRCKCRKKLTGRKINFESQNMIVCPNCGRKHYIDVNFVDWEKANQSKNVH